MSPLRCCLCLRRCKVLLDLAYGPTCIPCLKDALDQPTPDDAAALLCAAILEEE